MPCSSPFLPTPPPNQMRAGKTELGQESRCDSQWRTLLPLSPNTANNLHTDIRNYHIPALAEIQGFYHVPLLEPGAMLWVGFVCLLELISNAQR